MVTRSELVNDEELRFLADGSFAPDRSVRSLCLLNSDDPSGSQSIRGAL